MFPERFTAGIMDKIGIAKLDIDLAAIVESSGIELSSKYGKHVGLCPFHSDTAPSFYVYDDHFHCYGCGAHGDVIEFVRRLHGYSFKEALQHLGIETGKPTRKKIIQFQKKRVKQKQYQQRERDLAFTIGTMIRWTHTAMTAIKTEDDMSNFADLYHALPFWEHCHDILCQGDHETRRQVVESLKGIEIIERNLLFKPDFDFSGWLRNFINGEPQSGPKVNVNTIEF
jgi:ligand-binding SRPBCC domain-containing protein